VPLVVVALGGVIYLITTWLVPTFERWQDLRKQKPLMAHRAPADQVAFDNAPDDAAAGAPTSADPGLTRPATQPILYLPPQWHSRPDGITEMRPTNLAFLHARTSPGGNQRLVAIECLPDQEVVVAPVLGLTPDDRCLRFRFCSIRPATWRQSASFALTARIPFRVLTTGRRFRLFAGQPDPSDPSHFTFDYECDGHRGVIDAWLRDDDKIDLKPRDGTLHFASIWWLWKPPVPPATRPVQ
jgi:hypothetical protein